MGAAEGGIGAAEAALAAAGTKANGNLPGPCSGLPLGPAGAPLVFNQLFNVSVSFRHLTSLTGRKYLSSLSPHTFQKWHLSAEPWNHWKEWQEVAGRSRRGGARRSL